MDITIVIPTKNAGKQLENVLNAITNQKTDYSFEIICVDSGSKDNTIDIIKRFSKVILYQIPASEFGHGKTRNYGASKGTGNFIVFITQDALPASENWLDNLVKPIEADELCVGGFGIHYPYPDCNLLDKRDLEVHFNNFGIDNRYFWITDWNRYHNDEGYRHVLAFYSDNNSCMRRSIWEKYPYPDVDFAEDQIWARTIIEMGYHKAYCAHAAVYHSHNYDLKTFLGRYFDEYRGLYKLHGYVILPSKWMIFPAAVKHILSDFKYILSDENKLTLSEKRYWLQYALIRNMYRYIGGWLGGNYHNYSECKQKWLDKHISQQYKQRKS